MTPREIAEKLHDHYCVQECRWHHPGEELKGEAEITEAVDAATKPLREEVERLKAELADAKDRVEAIRELRQIETDQACAFADQSAKLADERADQAEARNKALVEALRRLDNLNGHFGSGPHCTCSQHLREEVIHTALSAHEERSKA